MLNIKKILIFFIIYNFYSINYKKLTIYYLPTISLSLFLTNDFYLYKKKNKLIDLYEKEKNNFYYYFECYFNKMNFKELSILNYENKVFKVNNDKYKDIKKNLKTYFDENLDIKNINLDLNTEEKLYKYFLENPMKISIYLKSIYNFLEERKNESIKNNIILFKNFFKKIILKILNYNSSKKTISYSIKTSSQSSSQYNEKYKLIKNNIELFKKFFKKINSTAIEFEEKIKSEIENIDNTKKYFIDFDYKNKKLITKNLKLNLTDHDQIKIFKENLENSDHESYKNIHDQIKIFKENLENSDHESYKNISDYLVFKEEEEEKEKQIKDVKQYVTDFYSEYDSKIYNKYNSIIEYNIDDGNYDVNSYCNDNYIEEFLKDYNNKAIDFEKIKFYIDNHEDIDNNKNFENQEKKTILLTFLNKIYNIHIYDIYYSYPEKINN